MIAEPPKVSAASVFIHQTKIDILRTLKEGPRNIARLAEEVGVDRSVLCYHLGKLEDGGLIDSEYGVITDPSEGRKGMCVREFYRNEEGIERALKPIWDFVDYCKGLHEALGTS